MDSEKIFLAEIRKGWKRIEGKIPLEKRKLYIDRIKYEIEVVKKLQFVDYFLIVWDFVGWAKKNRIRVGPGRGSAAGSLISYLLDITKVDPIPHDLLFERFLNEGRRSLPDIDLDFQDSRRDEVIQYLRKKYGEDRVATVVTYNKSQAKGVIRDVGRVMQLPLQEVNEICGLIDYDGTLESSLQNPELKGWVDKYPELFEVAQHMQGQLRNVSQHAAGVVITPKPLTEMLPVCVGKAGVTTQWDKEDLEYNGFVKFDLLALRTLTIIQETVDMIEDLDLDIDDLPLNDQVVLEMLSEGDTTGVFQFDTYLNKRLLREIKPRNFSELVALVSLGRPGAKDGVEFYIAGREDGENVDCLHPSLQSVLKETYGCLIYQEQSMKIAQILAGFTLQQADVMRRAISKSVEGGIEKLKDQWLAGTRKNGVDDRVALSVFDIIKQSERYSFNKSHATVYAYIAWQTAWLKAHYPREFMASVMSHTVDLDKTLKTQIKEVRRMGIEILPVHINRSFENFTKETSGIRIGFCSIKGLGSNVGKEIVEKRPYSSFRDFLSKINRRIARRNSIMALLEADAFYDFPENRDEMLLLLDGEKKKEKNVKYVNLFGETEVLDL